MRATPPLPEDEPLLAADDEGAVTGVRVYGTRWWVLFQLSLLTFNQSLFWITFSPVTDNAKLYYGVDNNTVTWWMNIGVAAAFLTFLVTSKYLAARGSGLKTVCTASVLAQAFAMVLRLVPVWIGGKQFGPKSSFGIAIVYVAQFIVGAIGPMVMAAPPLLSNVWFPAHERPLATAVGTLCNNMGSAGGFLLGPLLVKNPSDMPLLLYTHAGIAIMNAVLMLAYFPSAPPMPPSHSAGSDRVEATAQAGGEGSFGGVWAVVTNVNFMTIALGFGVLNGVFNVWSGSFDEILPPLGSQYDQVTCGWLGFGSTMALIVGGICTGFITDKPAWSRSFAPLLRIGAAATFAVMVLFTIAMPTYFSKEPFVSLPFPVVATLIVMSGFTIGCCTPIAYEAAAEMTFPAPESTSANVIVLILNLASFVYLFVTPPLIDSDVLNIVISGCGFLAMVLVFFTNVKYVRSDYEKALDRPGSVRSVNRLKTP